MAETDYIINFRHNKVKELISKYKEHSTLYIGVDFDGTVRKYTPYTREDYWNDGETKPICDLLRECKKLGFKLCLWSLSHNEEDLAWKYAWCKDHSFPMDYINESPIMSEYHSEKPYFNLLLDDVSGLDSAYYILKTVVETIKSEEK